MKSTSGVDRFSLQPMQPARIAFSPNEAAAAAGIGRTFLFAQIKSGQLVARKAGRRTLIEVTELHRWIESLRTRVSDQ
jgi:excisionase family DNA binding protein